MNVFELLAKIGLDDSDYKKGMKSAQTSMVDLSNKIGNGLKTVAKVSAAVVSTGAAALTALGKVAIDSYAEYEQLVGGVDTLFKESSKTVQDYAANAYMTAGMSANEYMSTVTSFSASLISSLGGDTAKAAEYADMAITDMADNANKMGTSMELIQNAYQGFAKQNYTMLDNLKLGYGGTKTEMERLLKDAEAIQKKNGVLVDYTIDDFGDIVEAIHVVQEEMDIAGATSEEASGTIQGSINAMKGAWENFKTALADPNQDLTAAFDNLMTSVETVAQNIGPKIEKMLPRIIQALEMLVTEAWAYLQPKLVQFADDAILALTDGMVGFDEVWAAIENGFNWIMENKDAIITALVGIGGALGAIFVVGQITAFITALTLIMNPVTLIVGAIGGLVSVITYLWTTSESFRTAVVQIWEGVKAGFLAAVDGIYAGVVRVAEFFVVDIPNACGQMFDLVTGFFANLVAQAASDFDTLKSDISNAMESAKSTVSGILDAIGSKFSSIFETIKSTVKNGIDKVRSFFNFEWSLPHIALPHFSISGKFSLNPPSIPHFSVSWYKKAMDNAMLLNGATIFGAYGNTLLGGGEAGPEVVSGADTLMNMIREAVSWRDGGQEKQTSAKIISPVFNITINGAQYEDEDELARNLMIRMQYEYDRRAAALA